MEYQFYFRSVSWFSFVVKKKRNDTFELYTLVYVVYVVANVERTGIVDDKERNNKTKEKNGKKRIS